ncbi:hypothetical protein [Pseudomonas peli]|uniref:hypothetical protein n=1 Tax=Pseudomonas peli TaxID=592361 RepID=UPI0024ADCABE|nr:hypothetical protein [Pseudomonas peli]
MASDHDFALPETPGPGEIDGTNRKIQVAIKASAMAAVLEDMLLQPLTNRCCSPHKSAPPGSLPVPGGEWSVICGELEQGAELFADGAVARDLKTAPDQGA